MPICRPRLSYKQRGFTYLLLLFMLVVGGAALAALGEHWQTKMQREREAELLFRGTQITDAIERFAAATPPGQPRLPTNLEELLEDRRGPGNIPQPWLRQLYADPFTGKADWQLLRDELGGISGVASASGKLALKRTDWPATVTVTKPADSVPMHISDWQFVAKVTGGAPKTGN
jgi:type II secretory pathway pseudopilin PulG